MAFEDMRLYALAEDKICNKKKIESMIEFQAIFAFHGFEEDKDPEKASERFRKNQSLFGSQVKMENFLKQVRSAPAGWAEYKLNAKEIQSALYFPLTGRHF